MPVYEYRCKSCGHTHEIEHGFHAERPTECPNCGGELIRVFHPIGLVFKGSGFHKTDYAGSSRGAAAGSSATSDAKPEAKPDTKSGEAKTGESKAAESKPKPDTKATGTSGSA
jgi:putative FmdB family regulatory protein